jgi:hypothetical protein
MTELLERALAQLLAPGMALAENRLWIAVLLGALAGMLGLLALALAREGRGGARRARPAIALGLAALGQMLLVLQHPLPGGLLHASAVAVLLRAPRPRLTAPQRRPRHARIALQAILLLGLALRLHRLEEITPGVGDYNAITGLAAIRAMGGEWPHRVWSLTPGTLYHSCRSPLYLGSMVLSFRLLGANLFGLRATDVAWAILSLILLQVLGESLRLGPAAVAATLALALHRWHAAISRRGVFLMAPIALATLLLALALDTIRRPRAWKGAALGLLLAASSYLYAAIRVMVVLCLAGWLAALAVDRARRRQWLVVGAMAGLVLLPSAWLQVRGPGEPWRRYFFQRKGSPPDVAIWRRTADGTRIRQGFSAADTLANLERNLTALGRFLYEDGSNGELFSVTLLTGLVLLVGTLSPGRAAFLLAWGGLALLPGVLIKTVSRRLILFLPLLALAAGSAAAWIAGAVASLPHRRRRVLLGAGILVCTLPLLAADAGAPFTRLRYRHVRDLAFGHPQRDRLARLLRSLAFHMPVVVIEPGEDDDVLGFLLHEPLSARGEDLQEAFRDAEELRARLDTDAADTAYAWMVQPGEKAWLRLLHARRPEAPVIEGLGAPRGRRVLFRVVLPPGVSAPETSEDAAWAPVRVRPLAEVIQETRPSAQRRHGPRRPRAPGRKRP